MATELIDLAAEEWREIQEEWSNPIPEIYPSEYQSYLETFVLYSGRKRVFRKYSYRSPWWCKKRERKDGTEYDQPFYDGLIDIYAPRHLDNKRWRLLYPEYAHGDYFWLGQPAPKQTRFRTLDFDNKENLLGYYRDGSDARKNELGEYSYPVRPVVTYSLGQLKKLKRLYQLFPDDIFCISSATFGVHIWGFLPGMQETWLMERLTRERLKRIYMGGLEIYVDGVPKLWRGAAQFCGAGLVRVSWLVCVAEDHVFG